MVLRICAIDMYIYLLTVTYYLIIVYITACQQQKSNMNRCLYGFWNFNHLHLHRYMHYRSIATCIQ